MLAKVRLGFGREEKGTGRLIVVVVTLVAFSLIAGLLAHAAASPLPETSAVPVFSGAAAGMNDLELRGAVSLKQAV